MSRHWPSCEHQRACGLNRPAYTFLPRTWIKRIWGICHDLFLSSQAKSSLYSLCGPLSPLWPLWVLVFRPARAFVLGNPACLCTKFRFWCFADNAWNRRNALKGFFVRGDLSIENNWILQNDKRRCMEVHKVHNTRQVPCSPWNIAEHRYRSNVHSLRAVHLHIGSRSRGQNHYLPFQTFADYYGTSLVSVYNSVLCTVCKRY